MKRKNNISKPTLYDLLEFEKFKEEQSQLSKGDRLDCYKNDLDKILNVAEETQRKRKSYFSNNIMSLTLFRTLNLRISVGFVFIFVIISLAAIVAYLSLNNSTDDLSDLINSHLVHLDKIENNIESLEIYNNIKISKIKNEFNRIVIQTEENSKLRDNTEIQNKIESILNVFTNTSLQFAKSQLDFLSKNKEMIGTSEKDEIRKTLSLDYEYIESFNNRGYKVNLFEFAYIAFDINEELNEKESAKEWFLRIVNQKKDDIQTALRALEIGEWYIKEMNFIDAKNMFLYILNAFSNHKHITATAQINLAYCLFNVGGDENIEQSIETISNQPDTLTLNDDSSNRIKGFNLLLKFCDSNGNLNKYAIETLDQAHQDLAKNLYYIAKKYTNYLQFPDKLEKMSGRLLWESNEVFYHMDFKDVYENHFVRKYKIIRYYDGFIGNYKIVEIEQDETKLLSQKLYKSIHDIIKNDMISNNGNSTDSDPERLLFDIVNIEKHNNLIKNETITALTIYTDNINYRGTKIVLLKGNLMNYEVVNVNLTGDLVYNNLLGNYRVGYNFSVSDVDNDGRYDILLNAGLADPRYVVVLFQTKCDSNNIYFNSVVIKNDFKNTDISFAICDDFNNDNKNELIVAYKSWSCYSLILYSYEPDENTKFRQKDSFLLGTSQDHYIITENNKKYFVVNSLIEPSYGDYYLSALDKKEADCGIFVFEITKDCKFKVVSNILMNVNFFNPKNFFITAKNISNLRIHKYNEGFVYEYNKSTNNYFDKIYPNDSTVVSFISNLSELSKDNNRIYITGEGILPKAVTPSNINIMQSFKSDLNRFYIQLDQNEINNIKQLNYKIDDKYDNYLHCEILEKLQLYVKNIKYIESHHDSNENIIRTANSYINSFKKVINKKVALNYDELSKITDTERYKSKRNQLYNDCVNFIIDQWGETTNVELRTEIRSIVTNYVLTTNNMGILNDHLKNPELSKNTQTLIEEIRESLVLDSVIEYNNGEVIENNEVLDRNSRFDNFYSFPLNLINEKYNAVANQYELNYSIYQTYYLGYNRKTQDGNLIIDKPEDSFFGNKVFIDENSSFQLVVDIDYYGLAFGNDRRIGLFKIPDAFLNTNQIGMQLDTLDTCIIRQFNSGGGLNYNFGNILFHKTNTPIVQDMTLGFAYHNNYRAENCRIIVKYNYFCRKLSYCIYNKKTGDVLYNVVKDNIQPLSKGRYYFGIRTDIANQHFGLAKNNFKINHLSLYGDRINLIKNTYKNELNDTYAYISYINRLILNDKKEEIINASDKYLVFLNKLVEDISISEKELIMREIAFIEILKTLYMHQIQNNNNTLQKIYQTWDKYRELDKINFVVDPASNQKEHWLLIYTVVSRLNDYGNYNEFIQYIGESIYKYDDRYTNYSLKDMFQKLIRRHYDVNSEEYQNNSKDVNGIEDVTISLYLLNEFHKKPNSDEYKAMTWINTDLIMGFCQEWRLFFHDFNSFCIKNEYIKEHVSDDSIILILLRLGSRLGYYGLIDKAYTLFDTIEDYKKVYERKTRKLFIQLPLKFNIIKHRFAYVKWINNYVKLFKPKYELVLERLKYQKKYLDLQYNFSKYHSD